VSNREIRAAQNYHSGTKHPNGYLMDPSHYYHPSQEPLKFKIYQGTELIELPQPGKPLGMPALEAVAANPLSPGGERIPALEEVSQVLYYCAGITKKIDYPWGEFYFRAAACTGALYHIEIYLACGDLPDLPAGLYHYEPQANALARLRQGDYRRHLIQASGDEPSVEAAPVILIFTDVFWRNAVKYQARAYRHTFWDGGTILSQTLAVCAAQDLSARVVMGFVDEQVNKLLGLDVEEEAAFALAPLGHASNMPAPAAPEVTSIDYPILPIGGRKPVKFAAIHDLHAASSLDNAQEVAAWRITTPLLEHPAAQSQLIHLQAPASDGFPDDDLSEVILRRGSARQFVQLPITFGQLSTLLSVSLPGSTGGTLADFLYPPGSTLVTPYLIVNTVDGLEAGSYVYQRKAQALEPLRIGAFRALAGQLALGQELAADASVNIYMLADLDRALNAFGNRGYRAAQLEAAIAAGRMYLAAYAQRFSATGLTFYDDAVIRFFSPHAEGMSVMFLIALGKKARRR
jgi:SagB-type dehydrogenase family enzyme